MNRARNKIVRMLGLSVPVGLLLAAILCSAPLFAQMSGAGHSGMLQHRLAAIKVSVRENQQKLHRYTWTETSQITINGNARPPKMSTCSYGPDGKVTKVPVGGMAENATTEGGRGGRFRQRIVRERRAR